MITISIPEDATLYEIALQAEASHLHLISDGTRTALSPVIPAGFRKITVNERRPLILRPRMAGTAGQGSAESQP